MLEQEASLYTAPDAWAASLIESRRPIVRAHLAHWQATSAAEISCAPEHQDRLIQLERTVSRTADPDPVERSRGREQWLREYLLPLARELNLISKAETIALEQLYRIGLFDQHDPETGALRRKPADQVLPTIRALLQAIPHHNHRVNALVEQKHCLDKYAAVRVVEAWRQCEQHASGLARGVMLAYLAYGDTGLLVNSSYPYTDELILIERQRDFITELASPAVLAQLRADVVALAHSWANAARTAWSIRLLHEPSGSEYRRRVQREIGPRRRNDLATALVARHNYDLPEARELVEHLISGGLRALVAYRAHSDNVALTQERYEQLQIRRKLQSTYAALRAEDQAALERLVFSLHAAIKISNAPLPLLPLLSAQPSSKRRIQVSRRFHFGLAALNKRRLRHQSRRGYQRAPDRKSRPERQPRLASQLISEFAKRSNLDEREARDRLRNFITYGAIGLLERYQRANCLDPRLISWLRLIKYGRLAGRVPWQRLMAQLDTYRRMLGLEAPISSVLARAVFNAIPRPSYWHSGQGEATVRLRQRGTLSIRGPARLHERWLVFSIPSTITLCDALGQLVGHGSHLVWVVEVGGLLPLAVWPSTEPPGLQEVCLAVYQAIWHPGAENWPVKGIPEQLIISADLMVGDHVDLDRAAAYLLCDVEAQPRSKIWNQALRKLGKRLKDEAAKQIIDQLQPHERTQTQIMRSLEAWIQSTFFPYHRPAPVWHSIAQHGVVMPGHDTPAAGWLLPRIGETTISEDSLVYEGRNYRRSPEAALLAGRAYIRHFPASIVGSEEHLTAPGIFVQPLHDNDAGLLWYVTERG